MKNNKATQLINNALTSLTESLEDSESHELKCYLRTMSRFHNYSFRNTLLIGLQMPNATRVAGFHTWKKLGRFVKKGERGIIIVAPLVLRKENDSEDESRTDIAEVNGFKCVYVFDISQTDGSDLPKPASVTGDPSDHIGKLEYSDDLWAEGCSSGGKIVIHTGLTPARDFAVKAHELAHEFLHHTGEKLSKTQKETEAEAVAYVVCQSIGLDTNTAFSDYIQFYKGDKETLMTSIQRIKDVSSRILIGLQTE